MDATERQRRRRGYGDDKLHFCGSQVRVTELCQSAQICLLHSKPQAISSCVLLSCSCSADGTAAQQALPTRRVTPKKSAYPAQFSEAHLQHYVFCQVGFTH